MRRLRVPRFLQPRRRQRRLLALVPFRDEMRFLPGLFENLADQVDGVIALDDQSTDESRSFVESQQLLIELLSVPAGSQEELEDGKNHLNLIEAAWKHDPDWLLGIDADERVEAGFRQRAEREIDRAEAAGQPALWVPFRTLWGSPNQMRLDGLWSEARKACLFKSDPEHRFHGLRLHSIWAPWPPPAGEYPIADLRLYHLRMIRAEDRQTRLDRYRRIDPDNSLQEIGYDHLIDEEGLQLQPLEPGRDYVG
jgi:hypothetical protein